MTSPLVETDKAPITHLRDEDLIDDELPSRPAPREGLGRARLGMGTTLAVLGLPLLTLALVELEDALSLEAEVLLYLLVVVLAAVVGGLLVAIPTAIAAAIIINFFFLAPLHTLVVAQTDQAVMLVVFVIVATIVSVAVEIATRRTRQVQIAHHQADTLSALAGAELEADESLRGILDKARSTFGMESVAVKARGEDGGWAEVERVGWPSKGSEAPLRFDVASGEIRLVGRGPALFAKDQRVLRAFATAASTAYEGRQLSERARAGRALAAVDRQRTSLLSGVGHDLRTPLAGIKAAVSSLRQPDVTWSDEERTELLETIEESADSLARIVDNLLDASRLEAGELGVHPEPVRVRDVIGLALEAVPGQQARVSVPDDMPEVLADPGLLERIFIVIFDNAKRHAGGSRVEVSAVVGDLSARILISDNGPGISDERRDHIFEPFRGASGRRPGQGLGLGLSVARGFAEAMGGSLIADRAESGGLLLRLRLPLAAEPRDGPVGQ